MNFQLFRVFVSSEIIGGDLMHLNINLWYLSSLHITDLGLLILHVWLLMILFKGIDTLSFYFCIIS